MQSSKLNLLPALALLTTSFAVPFAVPSEAFAQGRATPDFNGDGFADLAVGVPGDGGAGLTAPGAVNVIYGAPGGLNATNNQVWNQNVGNVLDFAETGDRFGEALAWGDFNADGFSDLAIGVPYEDQAWTDQGAVNVIYGTPTGLRGRNNQYFDQDWPGVPGPAGDGDRFGWSLAAGDYNGDGFDDLAVGVIGDVVISRPADGSQPLLNAGSVNVIYGTVSGLNPGFKSDLWTQEAPEVKDLAEAEDMFGWSLAAGDFDRDGFHDLLIGAPFEDLSVGNAGIVHMLPGSGGGLTDLGSVYYVQGQQGIPDEGGCTNEACQEVRDLFGWAVSAGDYNGDGFDDMAVGAPGEDLHGVVNAGQVHVLYGSANGPVKRGSQIWNQNRPEIVDAAEFNDSFGSSLASGDFDRDGQVDLAVGIPYERLEQFSPFITAAGSVHVLYGASPKIRAIGNAVWHQGVEGVEDLAERLDAFGSALDTADFDGDGFTDLAVGVPYEEISGVTDAGAVNVLYGSASGIAAARDQFWHQDTAGILEQAEAGDIFGKAVPSTSR